MVKSHTSRRIKFPKGEQKKFILVSKSKFALTWKEMADLLKISMKTLTDWKNEKFSASLDAVKIITKKTGLPIPKNIKVLDAYWYVSKGAQKGGLATYKKYGLVGNPVSRKKAWRKWWNGEGKFKQSVIGQTLPFKKPLLSPDVAEFVGIMLGDGGMTKNQLRITLHSIDDAEYAKFVFKLITKIFNIKPNTRIRPNQPVRDIEISRINLVKFCVNVLGLKTGSKIKRQVDIPRWIKKDENFRIACLRGLIDTDGSLIIHKYKVSKKYYLYNKIGFTSRSAPLLSSVNKFLTQLEIKNRISGKYDVRIEAQKDVKRYFDLIGSNNPKHLKKYRNSVN